MIDPVGKNLATPPLPPERDRLRKAAQQFEGVFIAQMFREMRATVPADESSPGQDMFSGLMDDALANIAAEKSTRGVGDALYRQLSARLRADHDTSNGAGDGNRAR